MDKYGNSLAAQLQIPIVETGMGGETDGTDKEDSLPPEKEASRSRSKRLGRDCPLVRKFLSELWHLLSSGKCYSRLSSADS